MTMVRRVLIVLFWLNACLVNWTSISLICCSHYRIYIAVVQEEVFFCFDKHEACSTVWSWLKHGTSNSSLLLILSRLCILKRPHLTSLVFIFLSILPMFLGHLSLLNSSKFLALILFSSSRSFMQLPQLFKTFPVNPFFQFILLSSPP